MASEIEIEPKRSGERPHNNRQLIAASRAILRDVAFTAMTITIAWGHLWFL